jgi:2-polyprenyl-3-methyl-5-hydroxy-6-metoxy-1,4-benzoquinol methylase
MLQALRKQWLRCQLKMAKLGDRNAIARAYCVKDPWGLDNPNEHFRFKETARVISEQIGNRFGSILEIGCGEALQTEYLSPLGDRILGIDPSPHAITRAKQRSIPNADFQVSDLYSYENTHRQAFSLVTACEVIYYLEDTKKAYEKLSELGETCVVTYYQGVAERLDSFFRDKEVHSHYIDVGSARWRLIWWRS